MRTARAIVSYAVAVVVLGALLAPWLFWLVQWLAATFPWAEWMARHPFKRIFNRSLMIVALAGLWPLLRYVGVRSWSTVGYARTPAWWNQVLTGFGLGVLSVGLAVGLSVLLGRREFGPVPAAGELAGLLLKLLVTGFVVALIEETFFRGGLQQALERGTGWVGALVIASAIYAALHFLTPRGVKLLAGDVDAWSGFTCLGLIAANSYAREGVVIGFISLFLAGGILGWAYHRTRLLYLPIGIHAGWVVINELVRRLKGGNVIEDWLTWPCLVGLWLVVEWLIRRQRDRWIRP